MRDLNKIQYCALCNEPTNRDRMAKYCFPCLKKVQRADAVKYNEIKKAKLALKQLDDTKVTKEEKKPTVFKFMK